MSSHETPISPCRRSRSPRGSAWCERRSPLAARGRRARSGKRQARRRDQDRAGRGHRGGDRRRPALLRREPRAGGASQMAGAEGAPSRYRAASDRSAAIEQGARGGRAVRRDRDRRSAEARARSRRGDGARGQAPSPLRAGQHRRGAAEGGRRSRRDRSLRRAMPRRRSVSPSTG